MPEAERASMADELAVCAIIARKSGLDIPASSMPTQYFKIPFEDAPSLVLARARVCALF